MIEALAFLLACANPSINQCELGRIEADYEGEAPAWVTIEEETDGLSASITVRFRF